MEMNRIRSAQRKPVSRENTRLPNDALMVYAIFTLDAFSTKIPWGLGGALNASHERCFGRVATPATASAIQSRRHLRRRPRDRGVVDLLD